MAGAYHRRNTCQAAIFFSVKATHDSPVAVRGSNGLGAKALGLLFCQQTLHTHTQGVRHGFLTLSQSSFDFPATLFGAAAFREPFGSPGSNSKDRPFAVFR